MVTTRRSRKQAVKPSSSHHVAVPSSSSSSEENSDDEEIMVMATRTRKAPPKKQTPTKTKKVASYKDDSYELSSNSSDNEDNADDSLNMSMDDEMDLLQDKKTTTKTRSVKSTSQSTALDRSKNTGISTTNKKPAANSNKKTAPAGKPKLQNNESFEMSEDDDDSDIEIKLQFVQNSKRRLSASRRESSGSSSSSSSNSESDDNDSDNDDGNKGGKTLPTIKFAHPPVRKRFAERLAEKRKRAKIKQAAKRAVKADFDSDDDSDSDVELVENRSANKANKGEDIEYISSDDDEEANEAAKSSALQRNSGFAAARERLEKAQSYHAEDVEVPVEAEVVLQDTTRTNVEISRGLGSAKKNTASSVGNSAALGPKISLKLRIVGGEGTSAATPTEEKFTIRQKEPMRVLLQQLLDRHGLDQGSALVVMSFDGDNLLDLSRTPQSYDMESEDLIDVTVKKVKQNLGPSIRVKLRTSQGENIFQIRMKEPFLVLRDNYAAKKKIVKSKIRQIHFHFDGENLDLDKTPEFYDMENDELIDVVEN